MVPERPITWCNDAMCTMSCTYTYYVRSLFIYVNVNVHVYVHVCKLTKLPCNLKVDVYYVLHVSACTVTCIYLVMFPFT